MRLLIAGSRNFNDSATFSAVVDNVVHDIGGNVLIVEGGARGADTLAREYALRNGIEHVEMNADWERYGKAAGVKRNEQMVAFVSAGNGVALYFWDGKSRGTANCIRNARKAGLRVIIWDTVNNCFMA